MIQYVVRSKKSPRTGTYKYYVEVGPATPVMRKQIIEEIEKTCTLTASDIKACLDALETSIIQHLTAGQTVRLGDLGSFRPTLNAYTYDNRDEVNAAGIKRVRVRFTPSGEMVRQLAVQNVGFQRVDAPAEPPADENE